MLIENIHVFETKITLRTENAFKFIALQSIVLSLSCIYIRIDFYIQVLIHSY